MTHWEMCKKLKFEHTKKWYMYNLGSVQENETHKLLWDHLISARRSDIVIINNNNNDKRKNCRIVDFTFLADNWVKLKENEKNDKYQDLARELKMWNMKVKIIPIVIGALGTVTKGSIQGSEDLEIRRVETIQTTVLLRSARIL